MGFSYFADWEDIKFIGHIGVIHIIGNISYS